MGKFAIKMPSAQLVTVEHDQWAGTDTRQAGQRLTLWVLDAEGHVQRMGPEKGCESMLIAMKGEKFGTLLDVEATLITTTKGEFMTAVNVTRAQARDRFNGSEASPPLAKALS